MYGLTVMQRKIEDQPGSRELLFGYGVGKCAGCGTVMQ